MRRLTHMSDGYYAVSGEDCCENQNEELCGVAIDRLAAYEDTGLEPLEITLRNKMLQRYTWRDFSDICSVDRFMELAKAEREGRLVVLPCKVNETLYQTIFYANGNFVNEFTAPDVSWILEHQEEFGKTVFLTREAAEAALR